MHALLPRPYPRPLAGPNQGDDQRLVSLMVIVGVLNGKAAASTWLKAVSPGQILSTVCEYCMRPRVEPPHRVWAETGGNTIGKE